ncbi:MAG TPA: YlmC/YmxH family sporulation protein [Firmicutes bacterium]|nr:YlmC/YmxH family sporulation protein [Bacillota bacterium]HHY97813.1 YlmC/YmxH family sporulation protein [Bacillota bacterium]
MVKTSELRVRDVVNTIDGRRLGPITDLEIDLETGRIKAIMVPAPGRFLRALGKYKDYVIPWERIKKIGLDVILVEMNELVDPRGVLVD